MADNGQDTRRIRRLGPPRPAWLAVAGSALLLAALAVVGIFVEPKPAELPRPVTTQPASGPPLAPEKIVPVSHIEPADPPADEPNAAQSDSELDVTPAAENVAPPAAEAETAERESVEAESAAEAASASAATDDPALADNPALADLVQRTMPSCVKISNFTRQGGRSIGSGFVVDAAGVIATNFHVIHDAASAVCTFADGTEAAVTGFLAADLSRDLALLTIAAEDAGLKPLPLAKDLPRQGESIFAVGSPLGLSFRVSNGIVSAVCKTAEVDQDLFGDEEFPLSIKFEPDMTWLQSDAAISHGNSGGPWLNMRGEVVGVCTWGLTSGNSLSFGSAVTELQKLVAGLPNVEPTPLAKLPRPETSPSEEDAPSPGRPGAIRLPTEVALPSGRTVPILEALSSDEFKSLDRAQTWTKARGGEVVELITDDHRRLGTASHRRFKLDGLSVVMHDREHRRLWANYRDGARDSYHILFDAAGQPVLFMQFAENRRHGVSCYLREDKAYVVEETERGKVIATHLVTAAKTYEDVDLADDSIPETQAAREYVQQLTDDWKAAEATLKRTFEKHVEPEKQRQKARSRARR